MLLTYVKHVSNTYAALNYFFFIYTPYTIMVKQKTVFLTLYEYVYIPLSVTIYILFRRIHIACRYYYTLSEVNLLEM